MLCLKGSSKDCRLEYSTMVCAAIRAANMLLPGGPGAQKDTLICVPPSSLPSVSRCASSAISAVANSSTAKRRKLPSCPWANCGEKNWGSNFSSIEKNKKPKKPCSQWIRCTHTQRVEAKWFSLTPSVFTYFSTNLEKDGEKKISWNL